MKTVKQISLGLLIVATLFSSPALLAQESEPETAVVAVKAEAEAEVRITSDSLIEELRQQLSTNIKNQVNMALVHTADLIKNTLMK